MPSIYDLASNYELGETGTAPGVRLPVAEAPIVAAPVAAPVAAVAQEAMPPVLPPGMEGAGRNQQLLSMLGKYFPQNDEYGTELKAARATMTKESEAFNKLLQDAIKQPQETGPSKAEMYFRLAAAFGAPTKTGNFMESLGKAGEAAATMNKEQREAAHDHQSGNFQQRDNDHGHEGTHHDRAHRSPQNRFFLQMARKTASGERNDYCIVTGEHQIYNDDGSERR